MTGTFVFPSKLVLTDDGSEGLPGWRWRFPSHGKFRQFPEKNTFMQWSTEQLNSALEALTKKTLVLEPFDGRRSVTRSSAAEPSGKGASPALVLYSPEDSPVTENAIGNPTAHGKVTPAFQGSAEDSGLDDLVTKLKQRAEQWKELTKELKRSQQRERDLRVTNAEQAARISELEEKSGVEYILLELGRAQAMNEELKATIRKYKDDARDSEWLLQRNQVLEKQLAEKTAELDATKRAVQTPAPESARSKPTRNTYPQVIIPALATASSREYLHFSASPATSSHSTTSLAPPLSADPVPSARSQFLRDVQPSISPADSSHSTFSRDPYLLAVSTTSSSSRSLPKPLARSASISNPSRDRQVSAIDNPFPHPKPSGATRLSTASTASSGSKSSQTPKVPANSAPNRPLNSTPDSYSLAEAAAAARRITQETTRFLEEKKVERGSQRFELEVPKSETVPTKRKAQGEHSGQKGSKRRARALFWDDSDE